MANSRYLTGSRPTALPSPLFLCTACTLFLSAATFDAFAAGGQDAVSSLPAAPPATHPGRNATAKKTAPGKKPQRRMTTLNTSAASRVSAHRAGSLYVLTPQRPSLRSEAAAQANAAHHDQSPGRTSPETPQQGTEPAGPAAATPLQLSAAPLQAASPGAPAQEEGDDDNSTAPAETPPAADSGVPVTGTFSLPAAPAPSEALPSTAPGAAASTPAAPAPGPGTQSASSARLYAPRIYYDRGTVVAEGDEGTPVRLESNDVRVFAHRVVLDTQAKTVKAEGQVRVERDVLAKRFNAFRPGSQSTSKYSRETVTETLKGDNFEYDFGTRQGHLDHTSVRLANFNITAEQLIINGQKYIARNVVVRPGGLSDEELKIYGTPPFNLRAETVIIDKSRPAPADGNGNEALANEASAEAVPRTEIHKASLYFRNLRLLPVPSALLRRGGPREEQTYQITPRIFFNSSDGVLVTARIQFPLVRPRTDRVNSSRSSTLDLITDLGVSTRIGFRGGTELHSDSRLGELSIGARVNDVVSSQLTDRIELDRLPEIRYRPPSLRLFRLPGSRVAGLRFHFVAGDYRESLTSQSRVVEDTKFEAQILFTTRMGKKEGVYLNLFARSAMYGDHPDNLNTQGFEVGYVGHLTSRINGQFSFRAQNVDGSTPFRFDEVEIRRELRSTFDIMLTPRWLVPIDLRYDIDREEMRDKAFGLLRNYKTFAYGLMYESARHELRLELRQGF